MNKIDFLKISEIYDYHHIQFYHFCWHKILEITSLEFLNFFFFFFDILRLTRDVHFDYFVFTQQWPPAVCIEGQSTVSKTKTQVKRNLLILDSLKFKMETNASYTIYPIITFFIFQTNINTHLHKIKCISRYILGCI